MSAIRHFFTISLGLFSIATAACHESASPRAALPAPSTAMCSPFAGPSAAEPGSCQADAPALADADLPGECTLAGN